jgi:integrase
MLRDASSWCGIPRKTWLSSGPSACLDGGGNEGRMAGQSAASRSSIVASAGAEATVAAADELRDDRASARKSKSVLQPPLGIRLTIDVEEHHGARRTTFWARIRWNDPMTGRRESLKRSYATLEEAERWVERMQRSATTGVGGHQSYGDVVTILATTALRISEVSGLVVGDIDLDRGLLQVNRHTYPGRGGLVTKQTKGRRRRVVPITEPLRATLERLTGGRQSDERLVRGPRGGVITTATLRGATGWDELVDELGLPDLVRHGLRHTALTWMADAGVELHLL